LGVGLGVGFFVGLGVGRGLGFFVGGGVGPGLGFFVGLGVGFGLGFGDGFGVAAAAVEVVVVVSPAEFWLIESTSIFLQRLFEFAK
jgi:hypothetical protein